jgi:hypothetical protein
VRPATLRKREQQIRCFASALVCRGVPAEDLRSLADLVSLTNLKEGLRFHLDRRDGTTSTAIADLATTLKAVARHWVKIPEADLQHIEALRRRLECRERGLTAKNRERLRALDDPGNAQALVNLPQRLMALADKTAASSPLQAARLARDAVAIELLLRYGVKIDDEYVYIANRHPGIDQVFSRTAWRSSWSTQLKRIEGVDNNNGKVISINNTKYRCSRIPRSFFGTSNENNKDMEY